MDQRLKSYLELATQKHRYTMPMKSHHPLDKEIVENYIQAQGTEDARIFVRALIESTIHVDYPTFVQELQRITSEFLSYNSNPIIFVVPQRKEKQRCSNFWVGLHIVEQLQPIGIVSSVEEVIDNYPIGKYTLIFPDDCAYTGIQIEEELRKVENIVASEYHLTLVPLIPYISEDALERMLEVPNVWVPYRYNIFSRVNQVLPKLSQIKELRQFFSIDVEHHHLIYFDHRIADEISVPLDFYQNSFIYDAESIGGKKFIVGTPYQPYYHSLKLEA